MGKAGADIELNESYGALAPREEGARKFVGIWPCGHTSLFVGDGGVGKSTAMHEWVAAVDGREVGRPRNVWGCDITGPYSAALIFGEDTWEDVAERGESFVALWGEPWYFCKDATGMTIEGIIEWLDRAKALDFVVIDPLRMFLEGNEDNSEVINAFYNLLNAFARRKGCAIVIVHHTTKGGNRLLQHMVAAIRGSAVLANRPRLVVAATEKSRAVHIGWIKGNSLKHDPVRAVLGAKYEGRLFRQDEATYTLIPLDAATPVRISLDDTPDRVLAALTPLLAAGEAIFQTGAKSLHARKMVALSGISRPRIEAAILTLIAAGSIIDEGAGLTLPAAKTA